MASSTPAILRSVSLIALVGTSVLSTGPSSTKAQQMLPGTYDPVTKRFRFQLQPQTPAAATTLYAGTFNVTIKVNTTGVPAGTKVTCSVSVNVTDPAGILYDDYAAPTITATGAAQTTTVAMPYKMRLSSASDTVSFTLGASANYTDSTGATYTASGAGLATVKLPANGATTPVTVQTGL